MSLILSTNVAAQGDKQSERPSSELIEPEAHVITDKSNNQWACYSLEGGKQLNIILIDYHLLWNYARSLESENLSLRRQTTLLKLKSETWQREVVNQKQRGDIYEKMYKSEYELRLKLEGQSNFRQWIPWAILIVETTAFAFVTTYSAVK